MEQTRDQAQPRADLRLWAEFAVLFVGVPLLLAFVLPPTAMFTVLGITSVGGLLLLHLTPGFAWRDLLVNWQAVDLRVVGAVVVLTAAMALAGVYMLFPQNAFFLPRQQPSLWLMIMLLYPLVSALPQELLFRPLFFRRYGHLFPGGTFALVLNAALFSMAHLMYWNAIVATMTFLGGLVFAWAYQVRGSFMLAVVLHSIAGQILFTSGLGILFYSGAVD